MGAQNEAGDTTPLAVLMARVAELESRIEQLEGTVTALAPSHPGRPAPSPPLGAPDAGLHRPPPPPPPPGARPGVAPPPPGPPGGRPAVSPGLAAGPRITLTPEGLLKWSGVVLVVLAAIFFVATAIDRGWIGPELQLAGATLIGLALLAGGFWFEDRNRPWSLTLTVGGAAVLPVCAAAAHAALDLVPAYPALIALAVVTLGLGWVATRLSMEAVAAVAGIAAVFLPFWVSDQTELPLLVRGGWLAVLVLAATGLGWHRRWVVTRLAIVVLAALSLLVLAAQEDLGALSGSDTAVALVVTIVVAAAAWAGPAHAPLAGLELPAWARGVDHRAVVPLPLWAWAMTGAVISFDDTDDFAWYGFAVAAAFALVAVGARVVGATRSTAGSAGAEARSDGGGERAGGSTGPASPVAGSTGVRSRPGPLPGPLVAAHLLGAGVLVSIAFATLTRSPTLLIGLAVQAAATAVLARLLRDAMLGAFAAVLALIATVWAATSTLSGWFEELDTGQHLANLTVVVLIVATAAYAWWRRLDALTAPAVVVGWVAALGWVPSVLVHVSQGQAAVSVIWAAAAAGALIHGIRTDRQLTRVLGLATLSVTLVKLLTVDLSAVDTLWRVALFLVVGAGLLRLGYVLPSLSGKRESQLR